MTPKKSPHDPLPPDTSLLLSRRIEAVTSAATPIERRAAARLLIRDVQILIREFTGPCAMQRYCLAGCTMVEQLGYETEARELRNGRALARDREKLAGHVKDRRSDPDGDPHNNSYGSFRSKSPDNHDSDRDSDCDGEKI